MVSIRSVMLLCSALFMTVAFGETNRSFSLTISPFHLSFPIYEFTGEYALSQKFGIAGIGGYGSMKMNGYEGNVPTKKDIPILELGSQAAYYLLGNFKTGMQVGAEILWLKIFIPKSENVSVTANGLAIGPLIGYKWTASFGLTLFAQGGYEFLLAQAKGTNSNGQEIESSSKIGIALVNLNAGWSF